MNKLVLIDGNAVLHRAYHAIPLLTTKQGEPINAVYGLVSMLLRVIQDLNPTHIAVAFDRKEPTFRHLAFKNYQAQRPQMDKELSDQFEKAKDVISAFGIPIYEKVGFEADDVIGTLAEKSVRVEELKSRSNKIDEVIIVTGDRDQLQLVSNKIKLYMPIAGLANGKIMNRKDVVEKMGVTPEQIPDYKALVGDPSDNYHGITGIGPKTAISLLEKYKTFDSVFKHLDEISGSTAEKLKKGKEEGEMSLKLARIVTDVPIEANFEMMSRWQIDSPQTLELFSKFGFKTLTNRVKEVGKQIASENQGSLF